VLKIVLDQKKDLFKMCFRLVMRVKSIRFKKWERWVVLKINCLPCFKYYNSK